MKKLFVVPLILVLCNVLILGFNSATRAQEPEVVYSVGPEAKITKFEYPIMEKCKIADKPCVTFVMTVMNVSDNAERFIAKIIMPEEGKSVGGFIPRKGKKDKATGKRTPPLVAPGKSVTVKYPALQFELPKRIEVELVVMK